MPNWENEIKNAIYEESLEGEERDNFILMMNLLKGRTPQEYITDIDSKIKKTEQEKALIETRINAAQVSIDQKYNAELNKVNKAYVEEVANISYDAPRVANLMDSMARTKKNWNDMAKIQRKEGWNTKDFDETFDDIMKELDEKKYITYEGTDAYQSLHDFEQQYIKDYMSAKFEYDSILSKEEMIPLINKAKENKEIARKALGEKPTVQSDLLDKQTSLGDDLKVYKENKQTIEDFSKNQYKQMQNVKINNLSPAAKEAGLDLLTQARIDYQTKLNGWQRMWANILPTWLYGNGKYVDKINSYKKSLKEVGFSDDEIKKAAPNKDTTYIYNEETKKYEGLVRLTADDFKEEKEVKNEDPNSLKEEKLDAEGPEIEENNDLFIDNQSNKVRVNFAEKEQNEFSFKPANNEVSKNSNQMKQPSLGNKDNNLNK